MAGEVAAELVHHAGPVAQPAQMFAGGLQIEVPPLLLVGVEGVGRGVVQDPQRPSYDVAGLIDGLSCAPQRPLRVEDGVGGREDLTLVLRKATARSVSADTMRPVSVSVPLTMAEAGRDRAKSDRTSQLGVLLDALVAHQNELTDLVSARSEKPTVSDGLFDRTPGAKGERFVGVSLRMKSGNLEVIDQLVDKHGADSRSQLVAAALSAYLA